MTLIVIAYALADRKKRQFGLWLTLLIYSLFLDFYTVMVFQEKM